ncbi:unnamed protein product [Cuscuta epithymum]|uniref:Uncharacterized protein n=1 Tax=Cuscuta epithymum TaxID=186058 RepID=A0AAV0CSJ6_9ASTE|nr:unnamed protein product [Cuscuta epithymum]
MWEGEVNLKSLFNALSYAKLKLFNSFATILVHLLLSSKHFFRFSVAPFTTSTEPYFTIYLHLYQIYISFFSCCCYSCLSFISTVSVIKQSVCFLIYSLFHLFLPVASMQ